MTTRVDHHALRIVSESYGKLFSDKDGTGKNFTPRPLSSERELFEQLQKQMFSGGVRAPILADIKTNFTCRLDIAGQPQHTPRLRRHHTDIPDRRNICFPSDTDKTTIISRSTDSFKFLLPNGSLKDEDLQNVNKEEWEAWKALVARKKDARDILYKNTYCNNKLRYRILTLPRIDTGRPRTSSQHVAKKAMMLKENTSVDAFAVPQPVRTHTSQKQRPKKHNDTEKEFFEVRRIKASFDPSKGHIEQHTSPVSQPADLFHLTELPGQSKFERPLKNENWKHRSTNNGVIRHYIQIPAIPRFGESRDKSAQAYKSYLESSYAKNSEQAKKKMSLDRENTELSMYGFQNRMLQSVIDVNKPEPKSAEESPQPIAEKPAPTKEKEETFEEETKTQTIEMNQVHEGEEEHVAETNRSNKSSKSIVVEIKSTWNEAQDDVTEQPLHSEEEVVHQVPVNSPLPDEGIDMGESEDEENK